MFIMVLSLYGGFIMVSDFKRLNFNMDSDLVMKVDAFADKLHISRSSAFAVIISQFFDSQDALASLSLLASAVTKEKPSEPASDPASNGSD